MPLRIPVPANNTRSVLIQCAVATRTHESQRVIPGTPVKPPPAANSAREAAIHESIRPEPERRRKQKTNRRRRSSETHTVVFRGCDKRARQQGFHCLSHAAGIRMGQPPDQPEKRSPNPLYPGNFRRNARRNTAGETPAFLQQRRRHMKIRRLPQCRRFLYTCFFC